MDVVQGTPRDEDKEDRGPSVSPVDTFYAQLHGRREKERKAYPSILSFLSLARGQGNFRRDKSERRREKK